jgi:hypothetical protein
MWILVVVEGINLHYKPYNIPVMNRLNFINEVVYLNVLAWIHTFTPYNPDEELKLTIGTLVILIVIFMIAVNVGVIVKDLIYNFYRICYKWFLNLRIQQRNKKIKEFKIA